MRVATLALVVFSVFVSNGFAANPKPAPTRTISSTPTHFSTLHEVIVNHGSSTQGTLQFGNGTGISINGGYFYSFMPYVQLGGTIGLDHASNNGLSATEFDLLGGGIIDIPFDSSISNAFFAGALLGFGTRSSGAAVTASQSTLLFKFMAGKRIDLFSHVSWSPHMELIVPTNGSYRDVIFSIRFLAASILF